ncbi:serine hydrolase domain-containing protein [Paenibacillus arenosi]|uniref:Beta-lactamase family protein n=1 Tax=Paenibacillus arenosi TaxID=2774142 RepID=A0ABR9AWU6_9BACL|nr:serine hydrolase domain-containing protein [Paenibacillus arenosi]MBD8498477.1 beta-lactamase family protein [Paenibacillus arenosi]
MLLTREISNQFDPVIEHVYQTYLANHCSGAAVMVIHKDNIVAETYWGQQSLMQGARAVQEDTQFHVASVRKSYIGFAVAYAVYHGYISSLDDPVAHYISDLDADVFKETTIRHLVTHTHGLKDDGLGRDFAPGDSWSYRIVGIELLCRIVYEKTGLAVAQILAKEVFEPLGFKEAGWYAASPDNFAEVMRDPNNPHWNTFDTTDGDKMNMYVSARELACWGYLHLKQGNVLGKQIVPQGIIEMATTLQSPAFKDKDLPQNGFLCFVKDLPAKRSEIGGSVPKGSYQILGYSNVALLVIPQYETVVVRMFNSWGSAPGYEYLPDIKGFGDCVVSCLK